MDTDIKRLELSFLMNPVPQHPQRPEHAAIVQDTPVALLPSNVPIPPSPLPALSLVSPAVQQPRANDAQPSRGNANPVSSIPADRRRDKTKLRRQYRPRKFKLCWYDFVEDKTKSGGRYHLTSPVDAEAVEPPAM
eukprot:m51a1_g4572 hypothetical protein (135) ;mRNA; f:156276-156948